MNKLLQLKLWIEENAGTITLADAYDKLNALMSNNENKKPSTLNKLQKQYNLVVEEYVQRFCKKQDVAFEFWVADQVGGIACFGDILYINFQDIVWDINSRQPKNQIIDWMYESVDNPTKAINYFSYSKGMRF